MATIEENYNFWNHTSDWDQHYGEAWSRRWGSSLFQWRVTVYPRIAAQLPSGHLLEIASGYGRWTEFLLPHCQSYHGIDLAERCVFACRQRFPDHRFSVNDGKSLEMVDDDSIDFCFSFESLVHANPETMESYLTELARVLKPEGVAFLHHSNLGSFPAYFAWTTAIPNPWRDRLAEMGLIDSSQWRDPDITAPWVREAAEKRGLGCLSQETVNWGTRRPIDAFTKLKKGYGGRPALFENTRFLDEVELSHQLWENYRGISTSPSS